MNPFRAAPVRAYQDIGLETSIGGASPHQLVLLLFDGALAQIAQAREHMDKRNVAAKGEAISLAIRIIGEGLRMSLDMERGGAIALQLQGLYDYMMRRLVDANLHNRPELLGEVLSLLNELRSAWAQLGQRNAPVPATSMPAPHSERRAVSYGAA
jgi:flagellar protein FliS